MAGSDTRWLSIFVYLPADLHEEQLKYAFQTIVGASFQASSHNATCIRLAQSCEPYGNIFGALDCRYCRLILGQIIQPLP